MPETLLTSAIARIMQFQSNEHGSVPYDGLKYTLNVSGHMEISFKDKIMVSHSFEKLSVFT